MKVIKVLGILAFAFTFFVYCTKIFVADINYELAQNALSDAKITKAMGYAQNAIRLNPLEPNYYRIRSRVLLAYLPTQDDQYQSIVKNQILADLQTAYNLNKSNLVTVRNLIPIYYYFALKNPYDIDQITDVKFLEITKKFYASVKNISPNDVGVYALLAKYEKKLGLTNEYNQSVEKVRKLRPDLLEWYESFK